MAKYFVVWNGENISVKESIAVIALNSSNFVLGGEIRYAVLAQADMREQAERFADVLRNK